MISSIDLTSRASSMTCWPSRTVMPSSAEGGQHRRLDDVDADRHVGDALGPEDVADLAGGGAEQAGVRGDRAAQADHPGVDVLRAQPRAVEPVVLGRRAEVPDVRVAAARQQRVAGHLVARPLADVGARDVADVVEVEQQDRAEVGRRQRRRGPRRAGRSRSRSTFQRSSQSTFIEPGEAGGGITTGSPDADRSMTLRVGGRTFVHPCYTRTEGAQVALAAPDPWVAVPECALTLCKVAIWLDTCSLALHTPGIVGDRPTLWRRSHMRTDPTGGSA